MKNVFILAYLSLISIGCIQEPKFDANDIVNQSIEVSGGDRFKHSTISFDFRDKHYNAMRNKNKFRYERLFQDSLMIKDVLSNTGFERYINETLIEIPDSMKVKYTSSVNAVHYFSVLPFGLNDAAVNKKHKGLVNIKNREYHKIEVTFDKKGGGEDFEDVFIYWINSDNFKADYIAYSYAEDDGMGLRFREAYNERYVNGIRIVDYNNYKPKGEDARLNDLDALFEKNELKLLSKVELKNVIIRCSE